MSPPAAHVVLGLDIGTTSAKAVAFAPDGSALGDAAAGYPLHEPEPGRAEQDPGQVVDAALRVLRDAAAAARDRGAEIAGVSISAAMHALVGVDRDGRAITPVVTWADTRAADQAERLRSEHPDLHGRTGTPAHPMAPLPKLMWFREHEPETFAAVARWGGLKELVLERLTGDVGGRPLVRVGHRADGPRRPRLGRRGARPRRHRRRPARAARARDRAVRADRRGRRGDRPRRRPAGRRGRRRRAAREPRGRRRPPRRRRVLDRDERRAAAHRRAPRGRSAATGLLLRAHARAVGRRRRDQQRRRRAAVGRATRSRPTSATTRHGSSSRPRPRLRRGAPG